MLALLDFVGNGDNRIAVFDWTGLSALATSKCHKCGGIQFGGQLFSDLDFYTSLGQLAAQKSGPIPLRDNCATAGYAATQPCPEGGLATNGDGMTQVSHPVAPLFIGKTASPPE